MALRLLIGFACLSTASAACAEGRGFSPQDRTLSTPVLLGVTQNDASRHLMFRVLPDAPSVELLPGDRSATELCIIRDDRPREPGAPMRARMSMRLDTGRDAFRPDFRLAGLGAVLARVTDALLDN